MVHWLALLTAGMLSALSLPRWRKACLRVGLVDAPGQRKIITNQFAGRRLGRAHRHLVRLVNGLGLGSLGICFKRVAANDD
jgi:hypothetical protein